MNNRRMNRHKYVKPQWEVDAEEDEKRKTEEIARKMENTEENFPTLGNTVSKTVKWGGTARGFAELAAEWKADDDARKAVEEEQRAMSGAKRVDESVGMALPRFNPTRRFIEQDEQAPSTNKPTTPVDDDDSGWVTVDSRDKHDSRRARQIARKEAELRRLDEMGDNIPDHSSSDESGEEGGETCWNDAPQAHETCWEGRHL